MKPSKAIAGVQIASNAVVVASKTAATRGVARSKTQPACERPLRVVAVADSRFGVASRKLGQMLSQFCQPATHDEATI